MVNIGTLFAFVVVCAAVLILRIQPARRRPAVPLPGACSWSAPLGILVNLIMMLFLPLGHLAAAGRLAGHRPGDLLLLRHVAQRHAQAG